MPKNVVSDLITDQEIAFALLVLSGTMTDRKAAEAVGLNSDTAAYTKAKPRVAAFMHEHRAAVRERLVQQETEEVQHARFCCRESGPILYRKETRWLAFETLKETHSMSSERVRVPHVRTSVRGPKKMGEALTIAFRHEEVRWGALRSCASRKGIPPDSRAVTTKSIREKTFSSQVRFGEPGAPVESCGARIDRRRGVA